VEFWQDPSGPSQTPPPQAKLVVGAIDDPLEHDADRVADQVMRMPSGLSPPQLSRKCAACDEEDSTKLMSKPASASASAGTEAPAAVHNVLRSGGQPLDPRSRAFF
jgi:hypothetical protein